MENVPEKDTINLNLLQVCCKITKLMIKTLIIDNYDSFTYNLFQYIAELGGNPVVKENNNISLSEIHSIKPTHIIISPGPGTVENPKDFGICTEIIKAVAAKTLNVPLLGVCLGHQGIAHAFGGIIEHAPKVLHGKQSEVAHDGKSIFVGIKSPFSVMRYHSLRVSEQNFPQELQITARVEGEQTIMALKHRELPIFGIQFHPESIGTPQGKLILKNFLENH